ncbi:MAG: short chain dehydrogenase [Bacteroidetes bacterium GWE2_42_24]|nr:MAG: short chain dehydrogenase [Bacteroidetes bacterium GWE2_42_24]OFY25418.1 MAG: short chain dehydrogenase [Bacteroidetes bacterium GWF2_43_11]
MEKGNKVVVITGASSGIGKALAFAYAKEKCNLVLGARNIDQLNEISIQLKVYGASVLTVATDVTIESDCKNLIAKSVERFGGIDVLINNAGISMRALFTDVSLDVIKELMDVNFWGTVYCTHFAMPYLLERKGSLTGVISIAGFVGLPGRSGYSASKFAVRGFLDTLRIENLKKGLHVLVVAPGFTSSNIRFTARTADGSPQGESPRDESGMMSAEDVAEAIVSAIRRRKSSLILTFVEGKFTVLLSKLFPRLLDRLAYNHMAKEPNSPFK